MQWLGDTKPQEAVEAVNMSSYLGSEEPSVLGLNVPSPP